MGSGAPRSDVNKSDAIRDYEARCCHVCRSCHAPFGFEPPMTRTGVTFWACAAHRMAVERWLTGDQVEMALPAQLRLL